MRRFAIRIAAGLLIASLVPATGSRAGYMGGGPPQTPTSKTLLIFKGMYGVAGPFLGAVNALRGVAGDDLPWVVKKANGKLAANGHLVINVKGLVFPDEPGVPEELRGINDEAEFRALVSCLTVDGNDVVEENVISSGFPANVKGNAKINARLDLPDPCIAPVVMVLAGSEDVWFAASGADLSP